jgi:FtsH-binding integral membrane protein
MDDNPTHPIQKFMDNTWLLLALGLLVPILSYTVWAWIELLNVPLAK